MPCDTPVPSLVDVEARLRSLAQEAIRTAVESIRLTRRSDGNRVDTAVLNRALDAYRDFQDACDPMTVLSLLNEASVSGVR